jgi:nanoRNase/pAp phosphatase (c-di-AMP/oligoRNAs hydrolase)
MLVEEEANLTGNSMALHETQQVFETLKRSTSPLICVPKGSTPDHFASAVGLARVLEKLEKKPQIISVDGPAPKNLHFLDSETRIKTQTENLQQFVIELDASKTEVDKLSYELKDGRLFVYLSPKSGVWDHHDVRFVPGKYRHDLIICIGAQDLESCAHLYEDHPEFFFHTPIINIDHSPANEHFGQINLVDITASAIGEVCHDLIHAIDPVFIDTEVATAFLTGMIAKTKSFKQKNVTARTLQTASKLISLGARRDAIVHNLYRTRSVETLRLWGRALARLKADDTHALVWTLLTQQDFMHAGAHEHDLPDVIDELISSSPHAKIVAILYEGRDKQIRAIVRTDHEAHAQNLVSTLRPHGSREEARITFDGLQIVEAEKQLIETIRNSQHVQN